MAWIPFSLTLFYTSIFLQSMTLQEAIKTALTILKQVMEEKLNSTNVEVACVTPSTNFHMFSKAEVEAAIQNVA
jgi:20S proteasome subunit alpha 5